MGFGLMKQEEISVNEKGEQVKTVGKIKTRSGNSIKLKQLLDESNARALAMFKSRLEESSSKV
jgi:arginyl-tRNA synthetase